jgi:uncharacterized protein YdhG (YjbR/CyaY superfamily)
LDAKKPTSIAGYIRSAPKQGQAHLRKLYAICKEVAPEAEETIKWNVPFVIEPRFLFSFNACKAHCNFVPSQAALKKFARELKAHKTTANFLQIPYDQPVPEDLVRRMARFQLGQVKKRKSDGFWQ